MAVYLYGISEEHAEAPPVDGLQDQPLRLVRSGGLSALVSDTAVSRLQGGESELWEHESAVEAWMCARDVLPAAFGTVLASDSAVRSVLEQRAAEFTSALRRVSGASELAVRAAWLDQHSPTPQGGAGYLEVRLDARRRAEALARRLDGRLRPLSRAARARVLSDHATAVSAAYLVDRERIPEFRSEVERLADDVREATLVCTGPWPPYSFTRDGEAA